MSLLDEITQEREASIPIRTRKVALGLSLKSPTTSYPGIYTLHTMIIKLESEQYNSFMTILKACTNYRSTQFLWRVHLVVMIRIDAL